MHLLYDFEIPSSVRDFFEVDHQDGGVLYVKLSPRINQYLSMPNGTKLSDEEFKTLFSKRIPFQKGILS